MGIPISVWGCIPNRVAPHTNLVFIEIRGVTYILLVDIDRIPDIVITLGNRIHYTDCTGYRDI